MTTPGSSSSGKRPNILPDVAFRDSDEFYDWLEHFIRVVKALSIEGDLDREILLAKMRKIPPGPDAPVGTARARARNVARPIAEALEHLISAAGLLSKSGTNFRKNYGPQITKANRKSRRRSGGAMEILGDP